MPYPTFKIYEILEKYQLSLIRKQLFEQPSNIPLSNWLTETLSFSEVIPLASEKARSELIIMPLLMELSKRNQHNFSIHSGITLDVDVAEGLKGECDFILSKQSPSAYLLTTPIFALIEAKKQDIDLGIPQCIAQMLAARMLNEQKGNPLPYIYGCVTTAEIWQFLQLKGNHVYIDSNKYYIDNVPLIQGVLQMVLDSYDEL